MNRPPGIGDFIASFKGDSPGHPFRGNQYEGGSGGSDYLERKEPKGREEAVAALNAIHKSGGYSAISQHLLEDVISHQESTGTEIMNRLAKNPKIGREGAKSAIKRLNEYSDSGIVGIGWKQDGDPRYFTNLTKKDLPVSGMSY